MQIFDLTSDELRTLLRIGQAVGIHNERDLLEIARTHNLTSGSSLINFVYAATIYSWLLEEAA